MSLRSMLARGVDRTFRGVLNTLYLIDDLGRQVRLRSGAVETAVQRTLQLVHGLTRRDPQVLRGVIAPQVAASLNAARRLNGGLPAGPRQIPWALGDPQRQPGQYEYLVRAVVHDQNGQGRQQQLTTVRNPTPLTPEQVVERARQQIEDQLYIWRSPKAADRFAPGSLVEFSTVAAQRTSLP